MPDILPIHGKRDIAEARRWLDRLADRMPGLIGELVVKKRNRTNDQNAKLHAMFADIARQAEWDGLKLDKDDWKDVLVSGWVKENTGAGARVVSNWQKDGLLPLGQRTRSLKVDEMSELIEFVAYAGAQLGVEFTHDKKDDAQ